MIDLPRYDTRTGLQTIAEIDAALTAIREDEESDPGALDCDELELLRDLHTIVTEPPKELPADLDHYAWRVPAVIDGEQRLLIPHSNPRVFEDPADGISATVAEAIEYLEGFGFADAAVDERWVLVHYRGEIVHFGLPADISPQE